MILVFTAEEEQEFDATRYSTDEHNNLELWTGSQGDRLIALFNRQHWLRVEVVVSDES